MQTRFLQLSTTLYEYRVIIFTALVLAILLAVFVMPAAVVEAGRAASTGG